MRRIASILIIAAAMFALGWWAGSARLDAGEEISVRIDTIYYERPQCVASTTWPITVNVPRVVFAPASSAPEQTPVGSSSDLPTGPADSVAVALEIETRLYEDSLYRAQVSGPAMAGYLPTLDWIETYSRTQTITRTQRHRFAVTAGVGAAYTPRGFQPTVGVQVGVVLWSF